MGLWGAAYQFQADPQSAVADLAAVQALGRSIGSNAVGLGFTSVLASQAFTMLAQNAPLLPEAAGAEGFCANACSVFISHCNLASIVPGSTDP